MEPQIGQMKPILNVFLLKNLKVSSHKLHPYNPELKKLQKSHSNYLQLNKENTKLNGDYVVKETKKKSNLVQQQKFLIQLKSQQKQLIIFYCKNFKIWTLLGLNLQILIGLLRYSKNIKIKDQIRIPYLIIYLS